MWGYPIVLGHRRKYLASKNNASSICLVASSVPCPLSAAAIINSRGTLPGLAFLDRDWEVVSFPAIAAGPRQ
jgi:hypothetical protein